MNPSVADSTDVRYPQIAASEVTRPWAESVSLVIALPRRPRDVDKLPAPPRDAERPMVDR